MNKNNGGPAFPTLHIPDCSPPAWNGMTKHDYFAAKAMQALIGKWGAINHKSIAEVAYQLADAMLELREKGVDSAVKQSLTVAPKGVSDEQ